MLVIIALAAAGAHAQTPLASLADWSAAAASLPCRETGSYALDHQHAASSLYPPDGAAFTALIEKYLASAGALAMAPGRWPLDDAQHTAALTGAAFAPLASPGALPLLPHVARVDLPLRSRVHVFGDLHGSFHSLLRTLHHLAAEGALNASTLALAPPHAALFLGDYVDRGTRGAETLGLLLALKTANPTRVFMARGNHEDLAMNDGSFATELALKFPAPAAPGGVRPDVLHAVQRVYETLPRALYVGVVDPLPGWCHDAAGGEAPCPPGQEGLKMDHAGLAPPPRHLQGCHGGLEPGFDPRPLLRYYAGAAPPPGDPQVHLALIHGFARAEWLEGLAPQLRAPPVMPPAIAAEVREGLFRNWGLGVRLRGAGSASSPSHALAQVRAARAAASLQWLAPGAPPPPAAQGGSSEAAWPVEPLATHPADGFMWADFIVSGARRAAEGGQEGLVHARGRGLAYGQALTDDFLRTRGLVGVLRAHQHNNAGTTGPMLDRVVRGRGAYNNWGEKLAGAGHVTTFLSGAFIPGLGFERDAHGLLELSAADPSAWSMLQCSQEVARGVCSSAAGGGFECLPFDWHSVRHPDYAGVDTGPAEGGGAEGGNALPAEWEEGDALPSGADL